LVIEGSIRNPRIATMFARPYMNRETDRGCVSFRCRAD
jgi:hypothetical protein